MEEVRLITKNMGSPLAMLTLILKIDLSVTRCVLTENKKVIRYINKLPWW